MSRPTYAHLPGGGPANERCWTCAHRVPSGRTGRHGASMVCGRVAEITGLPLTDLGVVRATVPACRHWRPCPSKGGPS